LSGTIGVFGRAIDSFREETYSLYGLYGEH